MKRLGLLLVILAFSSNASLLAMEKPSGTKMLVLALLGGTVASGSIELIKYIITKVEKESKEEKERNLAQILQQNNEIMRCLAAQNDALRTAFTIPDEGGGWQEAQQCALKNLPQITFGQPAPGSKSE